jgi:hypothetical protein
MAIMSARNPNDLTKLGQALLAAKMSIYNGAKANSATFMDIAKADKLINLLVVPPRMNKDKKTSTDNVSGVNGLISSLTNFVKNKKCSKDMVDDVCVNIPDKCYTDRCRFLGDMSLKDCRNEPLQLPYKVSHEQCSQQHAQARDLAR